MNVTTNDRVVQFENDEGSDVSLFHSVSLTVSVNDQLLGANQLEQRMFLIQGEFVCFKI